MLIALNSRVINKTNDFNALNTKFQNMELTPKELLGYIIEGHAFCTAVLQENADGYCNRKNDNFVESSVIAIDIDNAIQTMDENNVTTKNRVTDDEYLTYESILKDEFIRKNASFVYTTANSTDNWNRFRIVFILQTPIQDKVAHSNLFKSLNNMYLGDDATSANAQIFYGSKDASSEFFGNLLSDEIVKKLSINTEYDTSGGNPISYKMGLNLNLFDKEEISKILHYIFINGKLPNHKWWKVPTILKNTGLFTDNEIYELIKTNIDDTNDVKSKIKYAHRYKEYLSVGTLIHFAKENGYELPSSIVNSSKSLKFWNFIEKANKDTNVTLSVNIKYDLFVQFLINNGFSIIENGTEYKYLQINEFNQIEIVSDIKIRQFVIDFIKQNNNLNKTEYSCLLDHLFRISNQLFVNIIKNLPISNEQVKNKLIKDKNKIVYVFYENGFRKITKTESAFLDYSDLNGLIWKNSILKRKYKNSDESVSEIERFFKLVCTNRVNDDALNFNESKYKTLKSAIGYLLSREKIMSETVGVVLCDEAISDNPQGGSGKSIAALSLSKMRNVTTIDGRYVKPESQFKFETIDETTEIINFDDCGSKFDFQNFFSVITLDCTVEKKKVSRYTIPFEDSPKMIFSTNHIFQGEGISHERRVLEIEFSNYFNSIHTPNLEFGHDLFDGWDLEEWNRFDDFMAECIRYYLENGIIKYKQLNTGFKKLIENIGSAIAQYCDNYIEFDKIYRADEVTEELNNIMKTSYGQTKITKSVHYWAETYKKLYFYQEFNKNLKTTIYVISKDKNKELSFFKKQDQFKKLTNQENKIIVPRTTTNNLSYDDLFGM